MNDYRELSYAQGQVLRDVKRTGRIVPKQARSLQVVQDLGLVTFEGGRLVLTAAGAKHSLAN